MADEAEPLKELLIEVGIEVEIIPMSQGAVNVAPLP